MMNIVTSRPTLFLDTGNDYSINRFIGFLLCIPALITYDIISALFKGDNLWGKVIAVIIIIVLGILLLHTILWRLLGEETITFDDENLIIVRELLFLKKKIIIPGKDIQSVMENPRHCRKNAFSFNVPTAPNIPAAITSTPKISTISLMFLNHCSLSKNRNHL